jgi:hypothetical protein
MITADWFRSPPIDRDTAREALTHAQAELEDAREALTVALLLVQALAERLVPSRACDPAAERRVVGWLLSGRARVGDFAGLDAYDFSAPVHRWIYAFGLEVLEAQERGEQGGQPWPPELVPSRDMVRRMALLDLEDSRRAARRHPALRTKTCVKGYHQRCRAILDVLLTLPYPERVPQREIDLVAALGRAWSTVDEAHNVAPFEAAGGGG